MGNYEITEYERIRTCIKAFHGKSAWDRGVNAYAEELIDRLEEEGIYPPTQEDMLNGAQSWSQYSWGGCSLIYDTEIAERLAPPSVLKKKKGGELQPNSAETWLDCQARALAQAAKKIMQIYRRGI